MKIFSWKRVGSKSKMLFGDSQSPQQKDAICEKIPSLTALK